MQSKSEAIDEERQQTQVRFRPAPSPSTSKAADIDPSVTLVTGNQWNCRAKETFSVPTLGRYIEYSATDGLRQNGSTSHHGSALKQCSDESVGQQLTAVCGHLIGALQICIDSLKQHVDALLLEQTSTGEDRKPEYAVLYKLKPAQHRLRQLQLQLAAVQEVKAKILSTTSVKLNSSASMSQTGRMTVQKLKRAKSRLMRADPDQLKCHSELEIYMGSISFRPKGVAGFARVTKGDQFEIVVKHGAQKHRMRTKVGLEREQAWNPAEVVFKCTLGEVFELKVQEVKSFSKTTLLDTYLHYSELTVPEPIVLSIDLKRSGTLKLYVVVSWDALDFSGQAAFDYAAQSLKWRSMNTLGRTKKTRARSIIIDSISGGQLPYVSRSLSACGADYYPIPRARSQQAINNVQSPEQTLDDPLEEMLDNIAAGVRQLLSRFPEISGFYHAVNRLRFGLAQFSTREDADHLPHRMTEMRLNNPAEPVDYHDLSCSPRHSCYEATMLINGSIGSPILTRKPQNYRDDSFKRSTVMADDICLGYASETRVLQFRATIRHHLIHCQLLLQQLNRQGPLQYQKKRALIKLGQETEIVNCMAKLSDHLPRLASVSYVLSDHKASIELQNVWLSACRNGSYFILPMARVSSELRIHYGDVVCSYYPELLDKVMASLRHSLSDESRWAPQEVSVFQFITFFRDQLLVVLIESLAHETWINEGLKSRDVNMVSNIIEKLKQSPVVPPINCVRYVGMTLVDELSRLRTVAESYLLSLEGTMREDIVSKFIIFLEHEDPLSRRGACRSLAVLNAKRSVDLLLFVSSHDRNPLVRNEARKALLAFGIAKL
uniref:PL48 domain-containing protein n=1 Tax=Trichuris muris TaxID=70415 RepID=A0A5S6R0K7_TRIMR